jgi:IS5 family transposase
MGTTNRKRASAPKYLSPGQLTLDGFETPFEQHLDPKNRWVVLAGLIPWDDICSIYLKQTGGTSNTGRPPLSPRIVLGSLIIKHLCNLDDRETVDQITENMYMQYFLGYPSFTTASPFDASLFVSFRKILGIENVNAINEKIVALKTHLGTLRQDEKATNNEQGPTDDISSSPPQMPKCTNDNIAEVGSIGNAADVVQVKENKGRVIYDATACPQDIAFPTDLNLLSDAREKSEQLIDMLYDQSLHHKKPRTYRKVARDVFLKTAQKKNKSGKAIRKAVGQQLNYLRRNLGSINTLLDAFQGIPLKAKEYKYLLVINTLYDQQRTMHDTKTHSIEHRIVSIHQPHVRPIVRGKSQAKTEFGAKIHVSLIDGISFLDELSWDAFNEGSHMMNYVEQYHKRFGCYPRELLADKIYCTRANRTALKEKGIKLVAKPLGRPSAVQEHVSPGERNPIEGKFGQAKTAYGLNRIRARLQNTSESWIACIFMVLNLVKLAWAALPCLIDRTVKMFFSKINCDYLFHPAKEICNTVILNTILSYPGPATLRNTA